MSKFEIKDRLGANVLFECELGASLDGLAHSKRLGAAVKLAVKAGANLIGADLTGANLRDANLTRANLADAYLIGADLTGANLRDANLIGADLADAYLIGADLADADLTGANLRDAYLTGAYLAGANLTDANLAGAYLTRANLTRANLTGANLRGVNIVIDGGCPDGWDTFGWIKDGVIMLRVGCRNKTIDEGREYWSGKADRREVMAAIDYIESVAKIRGWINGAR